MPGANPPAVEAADLVKTYGGADGVAALRGVSFAIAPGESVALLGKSGSGKSTLLNLLGGLDKATSGTLRVAGKDLSRMNAREMADYRLTTVGMIFQSFNLIASRTALGNVELPMIFAGRPARERREAARAALEAVGLGHRLDHRPGQMSGGEQQRVAIARALVNDPAVLLADEPTGNLDSENAAAVTEILLTRVSKRGTTLIMVTHDEELAARMAGRVLRMKDGKLV
jgi:ABC-type lipoprotein export system ATPase subunit